MDLHHLPEGTHSLAPRPGSLVRWTFQSGAGIRSGETTVELSASLSPDQSHTRSVPVQANWSARQDSHLHCRRFELRASALGYTRMLAHGQQCPRPDLHRHCARFKCAVSALDYVGCWRRAKGGAA